MRSMPFADATARTAWTTDMEPARADSDSQHTAAALLELTQQLLREVHPQRRADHGLTLDSSFEKDIGLDSLARVELIARVEKHFQLALPERTFAEVETPRDLLRALRGAQAPVPTTAAAAAVAAPAPVAGNIPDAAQTLLEVLDWHVAHHPGRPHIQLYEEQGDGDVISYRQLHKRALRVAAGLQQRSLQGGEPVAIMLPSGPAYFYSFFGVLMAGGIPVPIYPPARPAQLEDHMRRHVRILNNCRAHTLITVSEAQRLARLLRSQVPSLRHIVSAEELLESTSPAVLPTPAADDSAFIQYTSGSTGSPKGVVLSHANLLANIRAMGQAVEASAQDVFVSWLPLYHDMGLIGAWLGSLYYAALLVVMSPLSFLARPERWLWAIHRYRGTLSAAPNFGYEYCLRRLQDEDLQGLDLGSWRAAFNGAEAVSPDTLDAFGARFAAYGFRADAMMPVYGLAEASVGLAFPPLARGPLIDRVERDTFMRSGHAEPAAADNGNALRFVSSGPPLAGHELRVVDTAGHELPERHEGRLEFRGPSSTSGYYRDAVRTRQLFHDGWLDTGDLAYMANGELYITGRIKDIIIRAGRNIYPHELEAAVGNIAGVRNGRVAVFGSTDPRTGTERLIVLAETRSEDSAERERLRGEINTLASDLVGAPPDEVVLAPPGTVLKTSSGKIRRAASRERFEQGDIGKRPRSVPWQVARVALAGTLPQLRRSLRSAAALLYAGYCWSLYTLLAPVVWLGVTLLPRITQRWAVMRACVRILEKATATPVRVNGLQHIPAPGQPCVLVANHASYLDGYTLVSRLPGHFRFIAKAELADRFLIRLPLQRIHTEFVQRFETGKGVRDTQHFAELLRAGHQLLFFPEGTFTRVPGLRPFYLGAFTAAAQAAVPVIPVAIRGTRSLLRSGSWFPHRGAISIEIGAPLDPREAAAAAGADAWRVAIALRDQCRSFILRHCGEPDLAGAGLTDNHEGTRRKTKRKKAVEATPKGKSHGESRNSE
jgi:1-acyl-sn-glycerol-3-phosphate acyltransferase